jgi:TM2 domain-containing membrane protein YozV
VPAPFVRDLCRYRASNGKPNTSDASSDLSVEIGEGVIGLVGAGGIGATLTTAFSRYEFESVSAILILVIIGFFGVAGIHRIFIGQIGMGVLYLLTAGLCFVGTIVDVINYKNLAFESNREIAREIQRMIE